LRSEPSNHYYSIIDCRSLATAIKEAPDAGAPETFFPACLSRPVYDKLENEAINGLKSGFISSKIFKRKGQGTP